MGPRFGPSTGYSESQPTQIRTLSTFTKNTYSPLAIVTESLFGPSFGAPETESANKKYAHSPVEQTQFGPLFGAFESRPIQIGRLLGSHASFRTLQWILGHTLRPIRSETPTTKRGTKDETLELQ